MLSRYAYLLVHYTWRPGFPCFHYTGVCPGEGSNWSSRDRNPLGQRIFGAIYFSLYLYNRLRTWMTSQPSGRLNKNTQRISTLNHHCPHFSHTYCADIFFPGQWRHNMELNILLRGHLRVIKSSFVNKCVNETVFHDLTGWSLSEFQSLSRSTCRCVECSVRIVKGGVGVLSCK